MMSKNNFGFVYIMAFSNPQVVKIGSAQDPVSRMRIVAQDLGINFAQCWTDASPILNDSYEVESQCHKALSGHHLGGFGPHKAYPRETFRCDFETAKATLDTIVADYEKKHPRFNRSKLVMEGLDSRIQELKNMLEDVVNELDLSEIAIEKHGPLGTPPAELVRMVLEEKDRRIAALKAKLVDLSG